MYFMLIITDVLIAELPATGDSPGDHVGKVSQPLPLYPCILSGIIATITLACILKME